MSAIKSSDGAYFKSICRRVWIIPKVDVKPRQTCGGFVILPQGKFYPPPFSSGSKVQLPFNRYELVDMIVPSNFTGSITVDIDTVISLVFVTVMFSSSVIRLAVMVATPLLIPVTKPVSETVRISGRSVLQFTSGLEISLPT